MDIEKYKIDKTRELELGFKEFIKDLSLKYNIKLKVAVFYDVLLISGDSELDNFIDNIRNDLINFAKNNLNENYKIVLPQPAYTSFSPHTTVNATRTYSISRVLKENESE